MMLYTKSLYRSHLACHLYLLNLYFLPVFIIYFYLGLYYKDFGSKRKKTYLQLGFFILIYDRWKVLFAKFLWTLNCPTGPNQPRSQILFHEKSSTQDFIIKILVATKEKKTCSQLGFFIWINDRWKVICVNFSWKRLVVLVVLKPDAH